MSTDRPDDEQAPADEAAEAELAEDEHFQATWQAVLQTSQPRGGWGLALILIGSLALFVLSFQGQFDLQGIAVLVGALLFHEAGHFVGMKLFGFADVKMFFIPFFGAAVSGQKHAAPAWQHCIVLLLGPLPGILLALVLQAIMQQGYDEPVGKVVVMLLAINGFNLLPFEPLDGGRFLNRAIFARHHGLEVVFMLLAAAGLGLVAWLTWSWILGIVAGASLLSIPHRYRVAKLGHLMRQKLPGLPSNLNDLSELERLALYEAARSTSGTDQDPGVLATIIKALHESAVVHPPRLLATLGLLALYVAGWLAGFATMVLLAYAQIDADAEDLAAYRERSAEIHAMQEELLERKKHAEELAKHAPNEPNKAGELARVRAQIQVLEQREAVASQKLAEDFELDERGDVRRVRQRN